MKETYRQTFLEEARENLAQLEEALLELENSPTDMELVGKAFRAMHTIKGSGAMFGFDDVAEFTHEAETAYDLVREGVLEVTKELIDLSLKAQDYIRMMLDNEEIDEAELEKVRSGFRKLSSQDAKTETGKPEPESEDVPAATLPTPSKTVTYKIQFRPHPDMFENGTNPIPLLKELRGLGDCHIEARLESIPPLLDCEPAQCYVFWDATLTTDQGMNAIKDVFIFVEDLAEITIDEYKGNVEEEDAKRLGELLIERGDLTPEDLTTTLKEQKKIGEILVDRGLVAPDRVQAALAEQEEVKKKKAKQNSDELASTIRVPAHKLDTLVDLVGELVTVQARITQKAALASDPELLLISEQVERLTAELRDNTMSIRMLPIGTTFGRFRRLVRDLSSELGKEIELITDGAETELDKTVLERLADPLVHLIRNSIDHGIEPPSVRKERSKAHVGTICLSAEHSGANVVIRIEDDGNGLDKEAILAKAIEKGITVPGAPLSDGEIYNLIFHPGFSTAKKVTNVSGRGVGMDVVKKAIDALKGTVDVESSPGKGTIVTIELPLTLAIIEGLLVTIKDRYFVLPLSIVEECVELTREDIQKAHGRNLAYIRGEIVPYIRLRSEFGISGDLPDTEQIVVTGAKGSKVGLVVDNVVGQHQTVIKSLGKAYREVEGISGATILGDGTVALVIDTPSLLDNTALLEGVLN